LKTAVAVAAAAAAAAAALYSSSSSSSIRKMNYLFNILQVKMPHTQPIRK